MTRITSTTIHGAMLGVRTYLARNIVTIKRQNGIWIAEVKGENDAQNMPTLSDEKGHYAF